MKHTFLVSVFILGSILNINSQEIITSKIVDSITKNPIPFATISLNNTSGVISNDFGIFQINIKQKISKSDSITINCLGYATKSILIKAQLDSLILLSPKSIDLDEVLITNKNYSIDEIIDHVKDSLSSNYNCESQKSKFFFRESYHSSIIKKNVSVKKTTISEFNQDFFDNFMQMLPKKSSSYTEILAFLYNKSSADTINKLDIIKAASLYDKKNEIKFDKLEEQFNSIARKHIKRDSYFKIKSGWFGSKTEIDSTIFETEADKESEAYLKAEKEREKERKENFLKYRKSTIANIESKGFLFEDSKLNIVQHSNKYEFKIIDYTFLNDNFVYKIEFNPRRRGYFKGIMYVNTQDFAILRLDFENVKRLKNFNLLGVSANHYLQKGTIIYQKNKLNKYLLKYFEITDGKRMGIKRPLKIIEKNKNVKGRRKQNEVSGNIDFSFSNLIKKELVVFENQIISSETFNNFKEQADVKPTYLPHYDPNFWKGYNVIEPNQAIKDFKSLK